MVELTLKSGTDKNKGKTIAADLNEAGIHIYTDKDFFDRRDNIFAELQDFLSESDIEARTEWTPRRKTMAKLAMKKLRFVWYHGASGKGADNGKFYKAMGACRNIVTRIMESLDCDASDDDLWLNNMDRLGTLDKIIMATFGADNTSIQKSFMTQTVGGAGSAIPQMDEDTKQAMIEAARQRNAKP